MTDNNTNTNTTTDSSSSTQLLRPGGGVYLNNTLLFGGAMFCQLPKGYMDLAQFRQIPDHQMVYVEEIDQSLPPPPSNDSNNDDNNSMRQRQQQQQESSSVFIMEILQQPQEPHIDDDEIIAYLFTDLANTNGIMDVDLNADMTSTTATITKLDDEQEQQRPAVLYFQADAAATATAAAAIVNDDSNNNKHSSINSAIDPPHALVMNINNLLENHDDFELVYRSGCGIQRIQRDCRRNSRTNKDDHHVDDTNSMETIAIQMFVMRLSSSKHPSYNCDILTTFTTPILLPNSNTDTTTTTTRHINDSLTHSSKTEVLLQQQRHVFQPIISSIEIRDVTLFGND